MIPMIKTSLLALMLIEFKAHWNDYSYIMIYLPSLPNLALGIFKMQSDNSGIASEIPIQLAGCMLAILPILTMYIVFQDKLIGNVAIGGLKG
jgi:multiple sugar transport system permease protein